VTPTSDGETPTGPIPAGEPLPASVTRSIGRSGAIVASGTLVSRILGFVNALLLYNTIGTVGQSADAFALANQLPNNIYAIIAGGTLTAVIVPAIVRASGHADGGERFLNKLVTLGITIFATITIAVTVAAPLVVQLYAQTGGDGSRGFADAQVALTIAFAYWCLPQVFFYAVFAILSEVLNARGVFWPYAWAPVINNLVFATVLLIFRGVFGSVAESTAGDWTPGMIVLLAGGATLGIVIQSLVLVVAWRMARIRFRLDFRFKGVGLGRFGQLASWTFATVLIGQAAGIVESNVVSLATGDASIATMSLAWLIFILPYSLVTLSIAIPYFTRMSNHASKGDIPALGADLTAALKSVLLLQAYACIAIAVLSPWIASLFSSTPSGRAWVAIVLICYLLGLIPQSMYGVLLRGWYSVEDTRTPFFLQLGQVLGYVAMLLVIATFPSDLIAIFSALALSIAVLVQVAVNLAIMKRRIPTIRVGHIMGRLGWYIGSMIPAALLGAATVWGLRETGIGAFPDGTWLGSLTTVLVGGIVMAGGYFGMLALTRNPELRVVTDIVARRVKRSRSDETE